MWQSVRSTNRPLFLRVWFCWDKPVVHVLMGVKNTNTQLHAPAVIDYDVGIFLAFRIFPLFIYETQIQCVPYLLPNALPVCVREITPGSRVYIYIYIYRYI